MLVHISYIPPAQASLLPARTLPYPTPHVLSRFASKQPHQNLLYCVFFLRKVCLPVQPLSTGNYRFLLRHQAYENMTDTPRVCSNCSCTETPLWRRSPLGPKTLCNACGVRMKKGRLVFVPHTRSFVTVESPAAVAKRQRKEREARESQQHGSGSHRPRYNHENGHVKTKTGGPNRGRPPTMPMPSHAAHVLHTSNQHGYQPNLHHHSHHPQYGQSQMTPRSSGVAKSTVKKNRKSFKGPPGLYYLLAAIEFVETS